jgi:hypothetical protein
MPRHNTPFQNSKSNSQNGRFNVVMKEIVVYDENLVPLQENELPHQK